MKSVWLTSCCAASLAIGATPALAADESANNEGLEEIVVTAQKRVEPAQAVPISITVISGEGLRKAGVSNLPQLVTVIPGLQFQRIGASAVPFLRGVGGIATVVGAEPATSIYVDGVYVSSQLMALTGLPNVASIEVLKGPQGTLFGRNATAGVINISTRRPSHDTSGEVSIGYGRFKTLEGSLYLTTGLGERAAIDITAYGKDQNDGWGKNIFDGSDTPVGSEYLVRSRLLLEPTEHSEVNVIAGYQRIKNQIGFAARLLRAGELGQTERGLGGYQFTGGFYDTDLNQRSGFNTRSYSASLNWLQHVGNVDLRSITSYNNIKSSQAVDFDGSPVQGADVTIELRDKTFTQEIQLLSSEEADSRLKWILGGYYYHQSGGYPDVSQFGLAVPGSPTFATRLQLRATQKSNSYAGFAQVTYAVSDAANITLGGRYTSDKRCLDLRQFAGATTIRTQNECATFNKFTYRASVDYHINKDVMLFAQASRGFKSGFYNSQTPQSPAGGNPNDALPVRPETLDAYEAGVKSEFMNRKLRVNISGFYYAYKDLQVSAFINATTRVVINAAKARIYGIDAEVVAAPARGLTLTLAGEILDAKYRSFPGGPVFTPRTVAPFLLASSQADLKGNDLINAPSFSGAATAAYEFPLANGTVNLSSTLSYNGKLYFDTQNRLKQPAYALLSGQVGWTSEGGLSISFWGRNLTGHKYYYTSNPTAVGDSTVVAEPRTYGIRLGAKF